MKLTIELDDALVEAFASAIAKAQGGTTADAPKATKKRKAKAAQAEAADPVEAEAEAEAMADADAEANAPADDFENEDAPPTLAEVREILLAVKDKHDHEKAMSLLTDKAVGNATGLAALKPEKYAAVIAAGKKLLK